jgi:hypothetical protein
MLRLYTKLAKERENMKPVPPVSFKRLIELLPPVPEGLKAEEVKDFKHAFAERRYDGDKKSLHVKIHDAAGVPAFYVSFSVVAQFKRETSEGYEKGVTINDNPGIEKYQYKTKNGELQVQVGKRFIVTVESRGMPEEFLRAVYGKIDTKRLSELK